MHFNLSSIFAMIKFFPKEAVLFTLTYHTNTCSFVYKLLVLLMRHELIISIFL